MILHYYLYYKFWMILYIYPIIIYTIPYIYCYTHHGSNHLEDSRFSLVTLVSLRHMPAWSSSYARCQAGMLPCWSSTTAPPPPASLTWWGWGARWQAPGAKQARLPTNWQLLRRPAGKPCGLMPLPFGVRVAWIRLEIAVVFYAFFPFAFCFLFFFLLFW